MVCEHSQLWILFPPLKPELLLIGTQAQPQRKSLSADVQVIPGHNSLPAAALPSPENCFVDEEQPLRKRSGDSGREEAPGSLSKDKKLGRTLGIGFPGGLKPAVSSSQGPPVTGP